MAQRVGMPKPKAERKPAPAPVPAKRPFTPRQKPAAEKVTEKKEEE